MLALGSWKALCGNGYFILLVSIQIISEEWKLKRLKMFFAYMSKEKRMYNKWKQYILYKKGRTWEKIKAIYIIN